MAPNELGGSRCCRSQRAQASTTSSNGQPLLSSRTGFLSHSYLCDSCRRHKQPAGWPLTSENERTKIFTQPEWSVIPLSAHHYHARSCRRRCELRPRPSGRAELSALDLALKWASDHAATRPRTRPYVIALNILYSSQHNGRPTLTTNSPSIL